MLQLPGNATYMNDKDRQYMLQLPGNTTYINDKDRQYMLQLPGNATYINDTDNVCMIITYCTCLHLISNLGAVTFNFY